MLCGYAHASTIFSAFGNRQLFKPSRLCIHPQPTSVPDQAFRFLGMAGQLFDQHLPLVFQVEQLGVFASVLQHATYKEREGMRPWKSIVSDPLLPEQDSTCVRVCVFFFNAKAKRYGILRGNGSVCSFSRRWHGARHPYSEHTASNRLSSLSASSSHSTSLALSAAWVFV